jgi:hypothetical protein
MCRIHDPIQWFKIFYGPLEIAGDLGKPHNGLFSCCLITEMHSATGARHENKEVGTLFNLLYMYLGTLKWHWDTFFSKFFGFPL